VCVIDILLITILFHRPIYDRNDSIYININNYTFMYTMCDHVCNICKKI